MVKLRHRIMQLIFIHVRHIIDCYQLYHEKPRMLFFAILIQFHEKYNDIEGWHVIYYVVRKYIIIDGFRNLTEIRTHVHVMTVALLPVYVSRLYHILQFCLKNWKIFRTLHSPCVKSDDPRHSCINLYFSLFYSH